MFGEGSLTGASPRREQRVLERGNASRTRPRPGAGRRGQRRGPASRGRAARRPPAPRSRGPPPFSLTLCGVKLLWGTYCVSIQTGVCRGGPLLFALRAAGPSATFCPGRLTPAASGCVPLGPGPRARSRGDNVRQVGPARRVPAEHGCRARGHPRLPLPFLGPATAGRALRLTLQPRVAPARLLSVLLSVRAHAGPDAALARKPPGPSPAAETLRPLAHHPTRRRPFCRGLRAHLWDTPPSLPCRPGKSRLSLCLTRQYSISSRTVLWLLFSCF